MISERQLARGFAAKWRDWAPNLNAAFLWEVGPVDGSLARFSRRWECPMEETGNTQLNDLISEVAFGFFSECLRTGFRPERLPPETRTVIRQRAAARIAVLRKTQANIEGQLNQRSMEEADQLALRLLDVLQRVGGGRRGPTAAGRGRDFKFVSSGSSVRGCNR